MGPLFDKKWLSNSIQRTASIIKRAHLLSAISKKRVGGRGNQLTPKRGSGGNSTGNSRFLLSDFPCSKKEWKTQADHRSIHSKQICFCPEFQDGNTEESEECHSSKRLGIFVGLDGRLFACPYSSKVTQIPSFHSKRSSVSFQSAPIRSFDQSLHFHSPHDSHCDISKEKSYNSSSLSRRLVVKKSISSNSVGTQTFHYSANHIFGTDHQSRKSDLIPTQMFTFIGMEFLTHMNIVRVPQARVQILLETVKKFSQKTYVSAREFLSLLGQLNAAADFVMLGRLHLRPLQMSLLAQWRPQTLPLQHQIKLTADVLHHLNWWKQHRLYLQGVPMNADPPSHHIFSDASLTGWGSHLEPEGLLYHGVWSKTQSRLHINILEMMAISLTLRRALQFIKNSTVLISTDNTTVVAYLNRQGGTHSPDLCMEVWKTLIWCHQNQINLLIKHIPGKFNVLADRLSRITKPISTEWGLNQSVANAVFRMTQFRSVRNSSKSQTSTVCISDSGPKGTFNRRSHNELESHTRLCVSSFPSHSLSDKQNKNSSVQSGIDGPLLAQQNVVSRTTQSVDIITNNSPDKTKPTRTAPRKVFASKSRSSAT